MTTKTKATNYVIVVDYNPNDQYLENQSLLGWDNDTDWFDHYTDGDDIITPSGRIKRNKWGLLQIGEIAASFSCYHYLSSRARHLFENKHPA